MKTNVVLTQESEDILTDYVRMSRPRKFKTKHDKINGALECLGKFMYHLDNISLLNIGDLNKSWKQNQN